MAAIKYLLQKILILLIRCYQFAISPLLGQHCRFYPSCSQYMMDAIEQNGLFVGCWQGIKRLLRCQPFCKGGIDPVHSCGREKGL